MNRENCEDLETVRVSGGFRPSSFAFVIISFSCVSQLLVFALYGARGDTGYRKKGLRMTTVLGGASLLVFAAFSERHAGYKHVLAAILAVFSNTMYGLSVIFYNSYLPILAKESEAILSEGKEEDHDYENELSTKGYAAGKGANNAIKNKPVVPVHISL